MNADDDTVHQANVNQKTITSGDARRFWSKVKKAGPDECWIWQAYTDQDGYGRFSLKGKKHRAHRVAVRIDGRQPDGKVVRHTCDNPSCVNPDHLRVGTQTDNIRDRDRKGRQARGRRNGHAKLRPEDIRQIRKSNRPSRVLAKIYGVSPSHIRMIKTYQCWTHL